MNFIRKNQILKQLKYRNYSSQNNIKFYMIPYNEQYESRDNENEIKQRIKSYGKWYEESDKPIFHIERQKKIKEFLQQY